MTGINDYAKAFDGDVNYDEPYNETVHQKLESIQCNARLALQELLVDRQEKNVTKNQAWKLSNVDAGAGNFAYFTRFLKKITSLPFQSNTKKKFES